MNFKACLKLQNVSGNSGYNSSTFMYCQTSSKTARGAMGCSPHSGRLAFVRTPVRTVAQKSSTRRKNVMPKRPKGWGAALTDGGI